MRVLFVTSTFWPQIGGAEIALHRLMAACQAAGHEVEVITVRRKQAWPLHDALDGIPITRVGGVFRRGELRAGRILSAILYAQVARSALPKLRQADLVFCARMSLLAAIVVSLARWLGKPAIIQIASAGPAPGDPGTDIAASPPLLAGPVTPATPQIYAPPRSWVGAPLLTLRRQHPLGFKALLRAMRGRNVWIVALTEQMRARLLADGFAPERIIIIPNGLDEAGFRAAVPIPPDHAAHPPTAIAVGRHSYEKGMDVLLSAWQIVHAALPEARLVLLGDGPIHAQLREIAARLGVADSVAFRGASPHVAQELGAADVFVLPSRWEGFSNALLEAVFAGLPCAVTDVSGAREMVVPDDNGTIVPVGDYQALAQGIISLLQDRRRAREMGARGRERARARFTQAQVTAQYLACFTRLVAPIDKGMQI